MFGLKSQQQIFAMFDCLMWLLLSYAGALWAAAAVAVATVEESNLENLWSAYLFKLKSDQRFVLEKMALPLSVDKREIVGAWLSDKEIDPYEHFRKAINGDSLPIIKQRDILICLFQWDEILNGSMFHGVGQVQAQVNEPQMATEYADPLRIDCKKILNNPILVSERDIGFLTHMLFHYGFAATKAWFVQMVERAIMNYAPADDDSDEDSEDSDDFYRQDLEAQVGDATGERHFRFITNFPRVHLLDIYRIVVCPHERAVSLSTLCKHWLDRGEHYIKPARMIVKELKRAINGKKNSRGDHLMLILHDKEFCSLDFQSAYDFIKSLNETQVSILLEILYSQGYEYMIERIRVGIKEREESRQFAEARKMAEDRATRNQSKHKRLMNLYKMFDYMPAFTLEHIAE